MSRRRRVTLVAHGIHDRGGMERALAELIRHAHAHVDFTVVSTELQDDLRDAARWVRVRAPQRPAPALFARFYSAAGRRLRAGRPDLVHAMGAIVPNPADLISVQYCHAAYRRPRPAGGVTAVPWRVNAAMHRALSLAAERRSYRPGRARLFAAASHGVQQELRRFYPGVPSVVIPNGVDLQRFRPRPDVRRMERSRLGAADGDLLAVFVGGDWDRKGLPLAIEALGRAASAGVRNVALCVVGPGDRSRFEALARAHRVADRVRFEGPHPDPERYFAAADVHVFPTAYEAFPLVALEAAASGLPVVATRGVNGIDELVRDGREGLLVERRAADFAAALATLARDGARRAEMSAAARARASEYTWARVADLTVAAYERLAGERR